MGRGGRPYQVHDNLTRLSMIIENGDKKSIKKIIRNHGINAYDGEKRTALIWASFFGKKDLLKWLIDNGSDVNWQDRTGYTGLHFCGQEQNEIIAEILLKNEANPNILDEHGNSPLWTALFNSKGNFKTVKLLRAYGADPTLKNLYNKSPNDMAMTIYKKDIDELIK